MTTGASTSSYGSRYASLLVIIANALLFIQMLNIRVGRIKRTDEPLISVRFGLALLIAIALSIVSVWWIRSPRSQLVLKRISGIGRKILLALIFPMVGFALMILAQGLVTEFQRYAFAFALWLIIMTLALSVLLAGQAPAQAWVIGPKLRSRLMNIALMVLLGITIPIILLEFGLRFWVSNFGTEMDRIAYIYSSDEISTKAFRFRGVPYVNFGLSPTYPGINSLGYRGPEIAVPKPDGVWRIVALGGSTTYGELLTDSTEAYPAQLEKTLRDEYGYNNVEVINGGVPAYTMWEALANFEFRVLDLDPDMIIIYHGINDLGARAMPSANYRGIPGNAGIWRSDLVDLGPSTFYRYLAINLGWMKHPINMRNLLRPYEEAGENCCLDLSHEETAARFEANPPIYFERNLRNLIAVAQANRVEVMLSSWAYFPDETVDDMNLTVYPYRQKALAEHNAVTERLAAETGVAFYDLFNRLPYNIDYWFADGIHQTAAGTHEQARQYAAFIAEAGLIPEPS